MSAITTPFVKFTDAITEHQNIVIPVEHVHSVDLQVIEANGNNTEKAFLLFKFFGSAVDTKIEFVDKETAEGARDAFLAETATEITAES